MASEDKNDETDTWKTIESDPYLSQFLAVTHNENEENLSSVVNSILSVTEQLNKLTKGISVLDNELQSLIFHRHDDLISQGTWVDKLESTLKIMQIEVQELLSSIVSIRNKIVEPYNEIETQCLILTRLHETSNILRCINEIQNLAKNLNKFDLLKASFLIKEVDNFCDDVDLTGIDIIENDRKFIEKEKQQIQFTARNKLNQALNDENESQIIVSIQVFLNLNVFEQEIKILKDSALAVIEENTKNALDIQHLMNQASDQEKNSKIRNLGPGRIAGGTFPGINVDAFRSKLWLNWSNLMETVVYPNCAQIYLLQYTVAKQNEHESYTDSDSSKENDFKLAKEFWNEVSRILIKHLIASAEESTFIKQTLEGEYPRLLRLHTDLIKKLKKLFDKYPVHSSRDIIKSLNDNNHFVEKFENAYLSRSISRLLDGVHAMFSGEGLPSTDEVDSFVRSISSELSVSVIDENLCKAVGRNIGKAICLFCLKCENLVTVEGNASQVIDVQNTVQQMNVNIANTIYYMKLQINRILENMAEKLPFTCRNEISKMFSNVDELLKNILDPIKNSLSEAMESIVLTMHQENFSSEITLQTPSLYLRELHDFINRAFEIYLKPFHCEEILQNCCNDLANRCIELFLRQICLLRPISNAGRQKLNEDLMKIECAISPLCSNLSLLGNNYKILRSFRSVILSDNVQKLIENECIGKIIPYSSVLLFLFSYAPEEMMSPHQCCSWSVARLSQWLDNHNSEREKLELINTTLQRYQQEIKKQNKTEFHEIFPVMMNLLEIAFKTLKYS